MQSMTFLSAASPRIRNSQQVKSDFNPCRTLKYRLSQSACTKSSRWFERRNKKLKQSLKAYNRVIHRIIVATVVNFDSRLCGYNWNCPRERWIERAIVALIINVFAALLEWWVYKFSAANSNTSLQMNEQANSRRFRTSINKPLWSTINTGMKGYKRSVRNDARNKGFESITPKLLVFSRNVAFGTDAAQHHRLWQC